MNTTKLKAGDYIATGPEAILRVASVEERLIKCAYFINDGRTGYVRVQRATRSPYFRRATRSEIMAAKLLGRLP